MAFLRDEEKQLLLDHYLDIEWCDDVSDLRCVRCHRVAINHHVSECQHIFCSNCTKFYSDKRRQWKCPQCKEFITQPDGQDFDVEVKIHQLIMFCPNKKHGCKYSNQLRKIPAHFRMCVDTNEAALPVEYTATSTIETVVKQLTKVNATIGELKDGMQEVKDKVERKFDHLERKTDDIDSKFSVFTEKKTSVENKLEDKNADTHSALKKHNKEFRSMKLQLESMNERIEMHEILIQQLMELFSPNVEAMSIKCASMTQDMETLPYDETEELNPVKTETYEWTIKDVKKRRHLTDNWIYESEVFTLIGFKYVIRAKLQKMEGKLAIRLQFKDGETDNENLSKNGLTTVKYIIRDRMNVHNTRDIVHEAFLLFFDCYGHDSWIFGYGLPDTILCPPYVKNDSIKISILFEPQSVDHSFVSNNGILMWTVDNYRKRKEEQIYSSILSPSFYTSPQGYRVRIQLLIDHSQSMSVEVYFLTGQHDDCLSLNFPHKTTVTMFNPTDPSKNLVKSEHREDVSIYVIQLERSKFVEKRGFINEDSLLLKVVIEPDESE